jgi:hypothetical protein
MSDEEAVKNYRWDSPSTWTYYNDYISNFKDYPQGRAWLIRFPLIELQHNSFAADYDIEDLLP